MIADRIFADKLCEEIGFCDEYVDPEEQQALKEKEEIEVVFF